MDEDCCTSIMSVLSGCGAVNHRVMRWRIVADCWGPVKFPGDKHKEGNIYATDISGWKTFACMIACSIVVNSQYPL